MNTALSITTKANNMVRRYRLLSTKTVSVIVVQKSSSTIYKKLLRTLKRPTSQVAGTYEIEWDLILEDGTTYTGDDYEYLLVEHTLGYTWNVVGMSATLNYGETTFVGYTAPVEICIVGNMVILGRSWDEGGNMDFMYVDRSVSLQAAINVRATFTDNNTNLSGEYFCYNDDKIFQAGANPYNGDWKVVAYDRTTLAEITFSAGSAYDTVGGKIYDSALPLSAAEVITGLAADNNYLYAACRASNKISIIDVAGATPTGTVLSVDTTSFTSPRCLKYHNKFGGRIWMITGAGGMSAGDIDAGTGALTPISITVSDFCGDKVAIGINNNTDELCILSAGSDQRAHLYDISAQFPTGAIETGTIGTTGGNSSDADVTNYTFGFSDNSQTTPDPKPLDKPAVDYDADDNIYILDPVNCRTNKYNSSGTFVESIMMQNAVYQPSMNLNDATRGYIRSKEFQLNADGTWSLLRNFDQQVGVNFTRAYRFEWVFNYGGHTFATLTDDVTNHNGVTGWFDTHLYELMSNGTLRDCGQLLNETGSNFGSFLHKSGRIYAIDGTYGVGDTQDIKYKAITGLDGSDNPIWSSWTTLCTLAPIVAGGVRTVNGNATFTCISDSGVIALCNGAIDESLTHHLELYDSNTGELISSIMIPTSRAGDSTLDPDHDGYMGAEFPDGRYLERGNATSGSTFAKVETANNIFFVSKNHEGRSASQVNIIDAYSDRGHHLKQWGEDRPSADATGPRAYGSSGNCQWFKAVAYDADTVFICRSAESRPGGMQFEVITGCSSINYRTIQANPPYTAPLDGDDMYAVFDFNTILADGTYIDISHAQDANFRVQSGVRQYDPAFKDKTQIMNSAANTNLTKTTDVVCHPAYNAAAKEIRFTGFVTFAGHSALETSTAPTGIFQTLDDVDKIVSQIGLGYYATDFKYKLWLNDQLAINSDSDNIRVNTLGKNIAFTIVINSLGVALTYGDYPTVYTTHTDPTCTWYKITKLRSVTKNLGTIIGNCAISTTNVVRKEVLTNAAAPAITEVETISSNEVQITFDKMVDATVAGFTMKKNGVSHTVTSIAATADPRIWVLTTAEAANGNTLLISYDSSTGATVNADGVELASFTDTAVTNNIAAANAEVVSYVKSYDGGFNISWGSPSFAAVAGNYIEVAVWNYGYISCSSVTDTASNTYTKVRDYNGFTTWRCENCAAHATNVVTANFSGFTAAAVHAVQNGGIATASATAFTKEGDSTGLGTDSVTSETFSTLQANQAVTCFSCANASGLTWTPPTGFDDLGTDSNGRINAAWKWYTSLQTNITLTSTTTGATDDKYQSIIGKKLA